MNFKKVVKKACKSGLKWQFWILKENSYTQNGVNGSVLWRKENFFEFFSISVH